MDKVKEKIEVMVPYTKDEIDGMNTELAAAFLAYQKVEDAKKEADEGFKADLAGYWATMTAIASELKIKKHLATLECDVEFDPKAKTKTYRNAAGEVVRTAPMNPKDFERQLV